MKTTLQEILHAVNIFGEDRDITVDGISTIAVCPPLMITLEGRQHFSQALAAPARVEYNSNGYCCGLQICDGDENDDEQAWKLLTALAGYCNNDKYKTWFEGPTAQFI